MKFLSTLLLCIAFSTTALASDAPVPTKPQTTSGEIQIPTQISGVVTQLQGVSFCMDGATHLIHSPIGIFRLKGLNAEVTKELTAVADGKKKVSAMGYPVWGPECGHISVYSVSPMALLK
jgi:hypothetical protein